MSLRRALLAAVVAAIGFASPALAQPNVTGQWSTLPYLSPVNSIHVALLHTGKLLMIEGSSNVHTQTIYRYAILDPRAGTFSTGTTPWDLFCNSMTFFPDGRLLISGGNLGYNPYRGLRTTTIFDPATEQFVQVEDMARGRWYPTAITLDDGGVMTFSGLDEVAAVNPLAEIYDVGVGWSPPYEAQFEPKYYPRMHLLQNGQVLMTGPDPFTRTFDPSSGTWSGVLTTTNYPDTRMYGSSVMLPLRPDDGYGARFVLMGGNTTSPTASVEFLDTTITPWSWKTLTPLDQARVTLNSVLLPNGKILTVGGSATFNVASTAAMNALLFDPATKSWSPAGTIAYPRMYHSNALLLPDATVWLNGSNPSEGVWEPHMEIYQPPYLFTSSGALAPRPTIGAAPGIVGYGQSFTVSTPDAASIKDVVLIRDGSATHSFDMEQRMLYTTFTKGSGTLTVTAPPTAQVAPPGYYMLFLVNQNGVPSVASFVQLAVHPNNQRPTATITSPSSPTVNVQPGQSVTFAGSAGDADGSIAAYHWIFPGGSPATSNVATPGAVMFPNAGTYTVSLTVLDDLGDNNASPPTVTVVVGGSPTLGAAITSPANGATVTGPVTVNMSATNGQGSPTSFVLKLDNATPISSQSVSGSTASATWDPTGVPNGSHTLNLTVTDGTGHTATAAITVTVSLGGGGGGGGGGGTDTTPPTVSITSPTNGTWTGNSINITATASDNAAVASIKLWGNGGVFATIPCSGASCSGTVLWITGSLPPAAYQVQAVATDTAGNSTTSAPVTINKDATSPVVPSGAPASGGGGGGGGATLSAAITSPANGATVTGPVTVNMSATNGQGSPTMFVLKLDNATPISSQSVSGSTASTTWDPTGVPNGSHTLNLTVTDGTGHTATASITVTVSLGGGGGGGGTDTTPPTVAVTKPSNGAWTGNSIDIVAAGSDNVGLTSIAIYGDGSLVQTVGCGAAASCNTGTVWWLTGPLPSGQHTITAVATDTSGNQTTSAPVVINK